MRIEGDFDRDGAVLRAGRRRRRARRAGPGGDRRQPRRPVAARQAGQRRRRRGVRRGLLQLAAAAGDRALHPRVRRRRHRRRADGLADRAAVPRPRAGQGARHPPAHAVAPGPAVLQHRRPAERQHVVPRRPGASRVDAAVRRRLAPWRVVHAPDVPRRPGEVVPRRHARRAARHRRPPRRLHRSSAGSWSPATPCSSTCSRCTPRRRRRHRTGGGCCRCASSATTSSTPRARGRRRRRSPASPTSCRPARRWTTRCSRSCGPTPKGAHRDERTHRLRRAARRRPRRDQRPSTRAAFGWGFVDYGPEYAAFEGAGLDGGFGRQRRRRARRRSSSSRPTTSRTPWPASRPPAASSPTRSSSSPAAAASTSATRPATCSGCGASDGPRRSPPSATRCCASRPAS